MGTTIPDTGPEPTQEERIARMVFEAIKLDLTVQVQSSLTEVQRSMETIAGRVAMLELAVQAQGTRGMRRGPKINPPEVYDRKSKLLADQFVRQILAAAEFEDFRDDAQQIVWAQSFLTGSAQDWSCVITTGEENCDQNPRHFQWSAWLADFRAAFCTRDPEQDALTKIGQLQQGSKSITDYCTAFF